MKQFKLMGKVIGKYNSVAYLDCEKGEVYIAVEGFKPNNKFKTLMTARMLNILEKENCYGASININTGKVYILYQDDKKNEKSFCVTLTGSALTEL